MYFFVLAFAFYRYSTTQASMSPAGFELAVPADPRLRPLGHWDRLIQSSMPLERLILYHNRSIGGSVGSFFSQGIIQPGRESGRLTVLTQHL